MAPVAISALIGAVIGILGGGVIGGIRYVGKVPPSRKLHGPVQNYLIWSRGPMITLAFIGAAAGVLIGAFISLAT